MDRYVCTARIINSTIIMVRSYNNEIIIINVISHFSVTAIAVWCLLTCAVRHNHNMYSYLATYREHLHLYIGSLKLKIRLPSASFLSQRRLAPCMHGIDAKLLKMKTMFIYMGAGSLFLQFSLRRAIKCASTTVMKDKDQMSSKVSIYPSYYRDGVISK